MQGLNRPCPSCLLSDPGRVSRQGARQQEPLTGARQQQPDVMLAITATLATTTTATSNATATATILVVRGGWGDLNTQVGVKGWGIGERL